MHVHGRALCSQQPTPFFGIRGRSFSGEPRQRFMSDLPSDRLALRRRHVVCSHAFRHTMVIFESLNAAERGVWRRIGFDLGQSLKVFSEPSTRRAQGPPGSAPW